MISMICCLLLRRFTKWCKLVVISIFRRVASLKIMENGWSSEIFEEKCVEMEEATQKVELFTKMLKNLIHTLKQSAS